MKCNANQQGCMHTFKNIQYFVNAQMCHAGVCYVLAWQSFITMQLNVFPSKSSWRKHWYEEQHTLLLLFSHLVMSDSPWPHGPEHTRPSCLPLPPRVVSNSCWYLQWHCPTISSSVIPFSSCPHTFLTSGSFPGIFSSHEMAKSHLIYHMYLSGKWFCSETLYTVSHSSTRSGKPRSDKIIILKGGK